MNRQWEGKKQGKVNFARHKKNWFVCIFFKISICRYFRYEGGEYRVAAWSPLLHVLEGELLHPHLSLTGNVNEMRLMWTSSSREGKILVSG